MFKKSVLEKSQTDKSVEGKIVFDGYAEVRRTPQNQPPFLKQRIRMGKDIMSIWFHHTHTDRFKAMDDWRGIKIISKEAKGQNLLPKIDEMTPQQILEFCKSIDVHPAHLVPWDQDKALSLPMPLLELLIEIAYEDISGKKYDQDDVYLAKAAISYECKRIREEIKGSQNSIDQLDRDSRTLFGAFMDVLHDPYAMRNLAKARIPGVSDSFDVASSRSYSYFARVHDIAVNQVEISIFHSMRRVKEARQLLEGRINDFVDCYHQYISSDRKDKFEAKYFLSEVMEEFTAGGFSDRESRLKDIELVLSRRLQVHPSYLRNIISAQKVFDEKFGGRREDRSEQDENDLYGIEKHHLREMAYIIGSILDGIENVGTAQKNHIECEGDYISRVGDIRNAFRSAEKGYKYNLLNNSILLSLYNISVQNYAAPQASPR